MRAHLQVMPEPMNPIRDTDDDARALALSLMRGARTAALAVVDPESGGPFVSLAAVAVAPDGQMVTLISSLSRHTRALRADPRACLLLGQPGPKGDPLTHPRLSLTATASFVVPGSDDARALRDRWLSIHPKAKLYIDFADFAFVRFETVSAALNGGFGKAYELSPADLAPLHD